MNKIKTGDKVYWNKEKWNVFLMWKDNPTGVPVCCLLNPIDTFVSSLKPIKRIDK